MVLYLILSDVRFEFDNGASGVQVTIGSGHCNGLILNKLSNRLASGLFSLLCRFRLCDKSAVSFDLPQAHI